MGEVHELGDVDVFTTGTLGQPGQRVFFLQARANGAVVTLKCEKQQVDALAVYLGQLLADLPDAEDLPLPSSLDLVEPLDPLFVLGGISVEWDQRSDRVVLTFEEVIVVDEGDDGDADPLASFADPEHQAEDKDHASVQLRISRGQALAFSRHGNEVVTAGRPTCRFCGLPKDLDGHPCPRMN